MDAPNSYGQPPDAVDATEDQAAGGDESNESDADTVLVDKSVFGDKMPQPGDKVTFTFVRGYEDEVELKLDDAGSEDSGSLESDDRAIGMMAE